jgi:hypothetical protein
MRMQQTPRPAARDLPPGPGPVTAFVQPLGIGLLIALALPAEPASPAGCSRLMLWRSLKVSPKPFVTPRTE